MEAAQPAAPSPCPPLGQPAAPQKPAAFKDVLPALQTYLDAGASLEALNLTMQGWGVKFVAPGNNETLGSAEYGKVLPGESTQVIVIAFDPAPSESVSRPGDLAVFACAGGRYRMAYQASADPAFDGLVTDAHVLSVEDVTGDGVQDLSFLTGECSAATCMDGIAILSAHGGAALRNLAPDFAFVPYPTFDYAAPADPASPRTLTVVEGMLGDPNAGPQRTVTSTWAFNGAIFTRSGTLRETASYRIHVIQDGDDALRARDFRRADELFGRATSDPSLQSWDANPNAAAEPQTLTAFAYFRLMQSGALRADGTAVAVSHDSLSAAAANSPAAQLIARMGDAYFKAWSAGNDPAKACAAASAFARNNPDISQWLGADAFGSANYDYQPEDMCL